MDLNMDYSAIKDGLVDVARYIERYVGYEKTLVNEMLISALSDNIDKYYQLII
jgi:hypothetical protein